MKPLSIDFDGTLHDVDTPLVGKRMGAPIPGAVDAMNELEERGFGLIIYTLRAKTQAGRQVVEDWLDYYDIPYSNVTDRKPDAAAYIDNKAIRFKDWPTTMKDLYKTLGIEDL